MTNLKVGIKSESGLKKEIITESKKVLEAIAVKYNCTFDFYQSGTQVVKDTIKLTAKKIKQKDSSNNIGLSFGGEIEL